jgi:hypothetical protein
MRKPEVGWLPGFLDLTAILTAIRAKTAVLAAA